jgi:hypothetical protein
MKIQWDYLDGEMEPVASKSDDGYGGFDHAEVPDDLMMRYMRAAKRWRKLKDEIRAAQVKP